MTLNDLIPKLQELSADIRKEMVELKDNSIAFEIIKTVLFECNKNIANIVRFNEPDMHNIINRISNKDNKASLMETFDKSIYMLLNADVFEGKNISQYVDAKRDIRKILNQLEEYLNKQEPRNMKRSNQVINYYNEVVGSINKINNGDQISMEALMFVTRELELTKEQEVSLYFDLYKNNVKNYEKTLLPEKIKIGEKYVEPVKSSEELVEDFEEIKDVSLEPEDIFEENEDLSKDFEEVDLNDSKDEVLVEVRTINEDVKNKINQIEEFNAKHAHLVEEYISVYGESKSAFTKLEEKLEMYSHMQGKSKEATILIDIRNLTNELNFLVKEYDVVSEDLSTIYEQEINEIISQIDSLIFYYNESIKEKYNEIDAENEKKESINAHDKKIIYLRKPGGDPYILDDIDNMPVEYSENIVKSIKYVIAPEDELTKKRVLVKDSCLVYPCNDLAFCYQNLGNKYILGIMLDPKNGNPHVLYNRLNANAEAIKAIRTMKEEELQEIGLEDQQITDSILSRLDPELKRGM